MYSMVSDAATRSMSIDTSPSAVLERKNPPQVVNEKLKPDVWCWVLYAVATAFEESCGLTPTLPGEKGSKSVLHNIAMLSPPTFMYIANLVLQTGIVYAFVVRYVTPEEEKYELPGFDIELAVHCMSYAYEHGLPLVGNATDQLTQEFADDVHKKCELQEVGEFSFIYVFMLFLWYATIIREAAASLFRAHQVGTVVERLEKDTAVVESNDIVALSTWMKVVLIVLVPVPKFLIAIAVGWYGSTLLMVQVDVLHIVTKALCLQLIMNVDEVLFKTLAPNVALDRVQNMKLKRHVHTTYHQWDLWLSSVVKSVFALGMALLFYFYGVPHLTSFRNECNRLG